MILQYRPCLYLAVSLRPEAVHLPVLCTFPTPAGPDFSSMLGEVLSETRGFDTLLMSGNDMGDLSLVVLLDGLKRNEQLRLKHLDLSHNKLGMHVGVGQEGRRRGREGQRQLIGGRSSTSTCRKTSWGCMWVVGVMGNGEG